MSILQSLLNSKKLENGMIWSSVFAITTIPIGFIANTLILPRLNLYPNDREIFKDQILKMLLSTSAVLGFIYGYHKSHCCLLKN